MVVALSLGVPALGGVGALVESHERGCREGRVCGEQLKVLVCHHGTGEGSLILCGGHHGHGASAVGVEGDGRALEACDGVEALVLGGAMGGHEVVLAVVGSHEVLVVVVLVLEELVVVCGVDVGVVLLGARACLHALLLRFSQHMLRCCC